MATLVDMTIQLSSPQLFVFLSFGQKLYIDLDISQYGYLDFSDTTQLSLSSLNEKS